MRNRQNRLEIRLSNAEDVKLREMMRETGFNASQFVRSLITHTEIHTRPPDELMKMLRELSAIGNNVNQLAHKANGIGEIETAEVQKMRDAFDRLCKEVKKI